MVAFRLALLGIILPHVTLPVTCFPLIDKRAPQVVPNKYIVTLKPGVSPPEINTHLSWVRDIHRRSISRRDTAGVENVYSIDDFNAYAGSFDAATIEEIRNSNEVLAVEPDMVWHLAGSLLTQTNAPWGLGSISHRAPGSTSYIYDAAGGAGTFAYILDTGLLTTHVEFEGRGRLGYNAVADSDFVDRHGHGTHVAGTIGARSFGVAKRATLISVKVFDTTSSTTSIVLSGFNWAVNNITLSHRTSNSVISMSLDGPTSAAFNLAVRKAYEAGVLSVVAAGNEGRDASTSSPGSAPEALTVSAVDIHNVKPWWANFGSLVDIFAPGVDILSCYIGSDTASALMEGTSMAAPHVAGLVLYLKALDSKGYAAAADASARIRGLATVGVVQTAGEESPDLLAYNGNGA